MTFLRDLARNAGGDGAVDKRRFIEGALQELSVAMCRGNGRLLRAGRTVVAKARGRAFRPGAVRPTADVGV